MTAPTPTDPSISPLAEATPQSLEEIFSASPLERTPEEWLTVVKALREMREKWLKDEAGGARRASAPKKAPKVTASQELSIDDLYL